MTRDTKLLTPGTGETAEIKSGKMLVVMHLHYPELADEMRSYLNAIPIAFDLCVTSSRPDVESALFHGRMPENLASYRFLLSPNRGRDIAPWLHSLPLEEHLRYDIALKIHGKKSGDDAEQGGNAWRRFLLQSLLGDRATAACAIRALLENPSLGLIIPVFPPDILIQKPHAFRWHKRDLMLVKEFLAKRQIAFTQPETPVPLFAAGSMFYYRPQALAGLLANPPDFEDFPPEPLPRVGTLAHAIERLPVIVARAANYQVARLLPQTMLDDAFLRYESALLADAMPVKLTIREFFGALNRSLRWRLLGK